jgi:hypothetical protein
VTVTDLDTIYSRQHWEGTRTSLIRVIDDAEENRFVFYIKSPGKSEAGMHFTRAELKRLNAAIGEYFVNEPAG